MNSEAPAKFDCLILEDKNNPNLSHMLLETNEPEEYLRIGFIENINKDVMKKTYFHPKDGYIYYVSYCNSNDIPNGKQYYYNKDGTIREEIMVKNGSVVSRKCIKK